MKTLLRFSIVLACIAILTGSIHGCSDPGEDPDQTTTTLPVAPSEQQEQPEGVTQPMPPISDAELEKAAAAYLQITEINKNLQQSVQQTDDAKENQKLQIEANKQMVQAAENAGLNYETYNIIMQAVHQNPAMEGLFQQKLRALE
jgi:transcriptional regulator with AAA-type ATPase domain